MFGLGRIEYHNSAPQPGSAIALRVPAWRYEMKKSIASITVVLLLTAFGCANWNRYTPAGVDDNAIATEIRKNLAGAGYTGMTVEVNLERAFARLISGELNIPLIHQPRITINPQPVVLACRKSESGIKGQLQQVPGPSA